MRKPVVGQVLTTRSGEEFVVEDVFSTFDPDDEDSRADGFCVQFAPVKGGMAAWGEDLLDVDFEAWCKSNGVSY
ncbi:hypothetical protein [Comamonas kerstersii]|uniref:hypothetical protein n=1 Tax=Comamonas kerstersii TaxID=225992 RepID=UPI0026DB87F9|nr:hypothetical protein [Comamonas kerstersii]